MRAKDPRTKGWRGLFALAITVVVGVALLWKGSTQQIGPSILIEESGHKVALGASDGLTVKQRPLGAVFKSGHEQAHSIRSRAETAATVQVLLDAHDFELEANTPLRVGLFKGLKPLDSCVITGNRAQLSTLTSGTLVVAVDKTTVPADAGFIESMWSVQREWGQWKPFADVEVGPGEEKQVRLRFIPSGHLTVTVIDPRGQPLEGTMLVLRSVNVPEEHQSLESDAAGMGTFEALRPGEYVLRARQANLSRHSIRAARVQVKPAATATALLQPEPAEASVSGKLTDLSGYPIEGATIELKLEEMGTRRAVTRSDGGFVFEGLLAGEVSIAVRRQELPIKSDQPAMDIVSTPEIERLLLLPNDKIDLAELAVGLEEKPTIALQIFAPDHITKEQIVVRQTMPTGNPPSLPTADVFRSGANLITTIRVRRPIAGAERLVTLWDKGRCLASTMIKFDSLETTTLYLE